MRVLTLGTAEDVARVAADLVSDAAARRPCLTLGLPTGVTTIPWYRELARRFSLGQLDLSGARSFNLDELLLAKEHPLSVRAFMERHSWQKIGLELMRCEIPESGADPSSECLRYDGALAAAGDLDLVFLGVGENGHVAYNLPGQVEDSTHVVELPEDLADSLEVPEDQRPLRAITVGIAMMRSARHLVLMATSASKAEAVRALLNGPEDAEWPCSLLREHPRFDVLLTRSAAGETQ